jgi:hypothetical protein
MNPRALLWARSGLVWLLATMTAGLHIGMTGQFGAASHHAHTGLLGGLWAVAFAWLFERNGAALTGAAKAKWAFYNLGVATMAVAMFLVVRQSGAWGPVIGLGGLVVLASTVWIVVSAWPRRLPPA